MQTKEVMELCKQIRQKMKDIDAFGKFGRRVFMPPIIFDSTSTSNKVKIGTA